MALRNHPPVDDDFVDPPSKTQRKAESHALQKLGVALVELDPGKAARLELPDAIDRAVVDARRVTAHEGRRRQLQYIGRLMRGLDEATVARIRDGVEALDKPRREDTVRLHRLEQWREALLDDDAAQSRWMTAYPATDTQQLRSLIRAARADRTEVSSRAARAYRELFQFLKTVTEQPSAAADDTVDD
ncbi:ribosome biogenesis factor YjgA [soil metagenome]